MNKESDSKDEVLTADASKKSQSKDKDKRKPVKCFNCHKLSHHRSKCWAKGGGDEGGGPKKSKESKDSASKAKEKKDKLEVWAAMVLPGKPAIVAAAAGKLMCRQNVAPRPSSMTPELLSTCLHSEVDLLNIQRLFHIPFKWWTRECFMQ